MGIVRAGKLAGLLGVSRTQSWRVRQEPDFPEAFAIGRRARGYDEDEIRAWLRGRRVHRATEERGDDRQAGSEATSADRVTT